MDERQTQITEGAGLEESRINKEFIDLLQKWSTPVLLLILLVAGAYAGVKWLENRQQTQLDAAFVAFRDAEMEGRPEALLDVAREHGGAGSVGIVARLAAADLRLDAYHQRVRPGTRGQSEEDRLSEAEALELLDQAGETYAEVHERASGKDGLELLAISGRWGVAAVELSRRDFDAARAALEDVQSLATEHGYADLADRAARTIESIPALRDQPELVATAPEPPADQPSRPVIGAEPPVGPSEGLPETATDEDASGDAGSDDAGPEGDAEPDGSEGAEPQSPGQG